MTITTPTQMITMEHMNAMLYPKGVAVVGATDRVGSVGRTVVENLIKAKSSNFNIYPVNPTRQTCLDLPCYPAVSAITETVEHVVVITPAHRCADVVRDCVKNSTVKLIVVIAAGFKEVGAEGLALELELVDIASKAGVAIVGPNCLGVQSPIHQMNATFSADPARPGPIAFISQSGAMCCAMLDWSLKYEHLGFSSFISVGSMSHVNWAHMIEFFAADENTKSVMIYMESIGNAAEFVKAAKKCSKPIIVIKAGRGDAAAAAAMSHTGSMAGSHDSFLAAMASAGVTVVDDIAQLQNLALSMSMQPAPTGNGVYIITNAGGPGVLSTDACEIAGLKMLDLSDDLKEELNSFLPAAWSNANPIDLLGDAGAEPYAKAVEAVMRKGEKGSSIVVILTPQSVTDCMGSAQMITERVAAIRAESDISFDGPVLCSFMGGAAIEGAGDYLSQNGVPFFPLPDAACHALGVWAKSVDLKKSTDIKSVVDFFGSENKVARSIINKAREEGRNLLTEHEGKQVLKSYGITVADSTVCDTREELVNALEAGIRYPAVVKLNSEIITHKSDVGGVRLNQTTKDQVLESWDIIKANVDAINPAAFQGVSVQPMIDLKAGTELLLGAIPDPQLGPIMVFGTGGTFVEIYQDRALSLVPIAREDCEEFVRKTKISMAIGYGEKDHGSRFIHVNKEQLHEFIERYSYMVADLHDVVSECEINPLLALKDEIIALDARFVLAGSEDVLAAPCRL